MTDTTKPLTDSELAEIESYQVGRKYSADVDKLHLVRDLRKARGLLREVEPILARMDTLRHLDPEFKELDELRAFLGPSPGPEKSEGGR